MKISKPILGHRSSFVIELIVLVVISGCSGGSLTTREKGAGIGAVGGAGAGALVGSAVGHQYGASGGGQGNGGGHGKGAK